MSTEPHPRDRSIFEHLGELPWELFPPSLIDSSAKTELYGRAWAQRLVRELELGHVLERGLSTTEILAAKSFVPRFGFILEWVRASLVLPPPTDDLAALRAELLAIDPRNHPTLDLLDTAARAVPALARGEKTGEEVLLGPAGAGLWAAYFTNAHPLYAISNRVAAVAAANRLTSPPPWTILEIGGGFGSAAEALFEELECRGLLHGVAAYHFTEPAAFFRRRGQGLLTKRWPALPLAVGELDIDRPWGAQGIAPGSLDLVYGVNVLHVAHDLAFTLAEVQTALKPGGFLVAGECLRPWLGRPLSTELIFGLLEGFTAVELDAFRTNPGFLTNEQWRAILERSGLRAFVVPDLSAVREQTESFLSGVVGGQRPEAI